MRLNEILSNPIDQVLKILSTNPKIAPFQNRIKIFGSVAQGKENPNDVDIMLDYSDFQGNSYHPSEIPGIGIFLSLAKKYYGYVDVFVKMGRWLYCRNELATGWTEAKHARKIYSDSEKFGKTLDEISKYKINDGKKFWSGRGKHLSESFAIGDSNGFMEELHEIQNNDPGFWNSVYVLLYPDKFDIGEIYIDSMGVRHHDQFANQGKGTKILKTLVSLADKYNVKLKLSADESSPSSHFLEQWYEKYGFYATDDYSDYGPVMIRNPEKNQITESQKLSPNPQLWQQALAPLTKTLYKEWRSHKWTWTTGGCFAFAEAFRKAYGGVLYGVCRIDVQDGETEYPVDHALVKLNGAFWDYNGIFDVSKIKKNQVIKRKGEDYVGWFEDDFLDDEQMNFLMNTMKKCGYGLYVMRIDELKLPDKKQQAALILLRAGYTQLGSGAMALVYAKEDSPWCIKLFDAQDKAYISFVRYCLKHPTNPHLPRFKSKLWKLSDIYYGIKMEKLDRLNDNDRQTARTWSNVLDTMLPQGYIDPKFENDKNYGWTKELIERFKQTNPEMFETLADIAEVCKGCHPDLHGYNVMKRSDGTLVIIDPSIGN